MLEEMVKSVISKQLAADFPHLQLPAIMCATVTSTTETGEEYEFEFKSRRKAGGAVEEYIYTGKWYEYNLKIIDKNGSADERFPEIPGVRSMLQIKTGKKVAVGLLYGELNPCIIGEVA